MLTNIRQLIMRHFFISDELNAQGDLRLTRRVFTKVSNATHPEYSYKQQSQVRPNKTSTNCVQAREDPTGAIRRISSRWIVEDRLEIGKQDVDNHLRRCSHMVLQKGDFVDATITADIMTRRSTKGFRAEVQFKLQRIIQLLPRTETKVS